MVGAKTALPSVAYIGIFGAGTTSEPAAATTGREAACTGTPSDGWIQVEATTKSMAEERIVTPRAPIHKHRNLLGRVAPRRNYGPRSAAPARARDRDRSRRPARPGRAAATVLVVGLVLLGAAAAEAQTTRTLVSNTGQSGDDSANTSGNDHAQLFHTGGHTDGYTLTSVIVNSDDVENDDFDVEICTADTTANEFPTSACTALNAPMSFVGVGNVVFTRDLLLSENTNYVVVIKQRGTGSVRLDSPPPAEKIRPASRTGASKTSSTGRAAVPG